VISRVEAAVKARYADVDSYTVTEHYAVFRNNDETHPAAEMTVRTNYTRDSGKNYTVVSESGSSVMRRLVLDEILANERTINLPENREKSWFTPENYVMTLKPGVTQRIDDRNCLAIAIAPLHKAPHLIEGTLWVDAQDFSTVELEGTSSKSPSVFSGPAHVLRKYANFNGFAEATYARAVSSGPLLGQTVVTIDYRDYEMHVKASHSALYLAP
jgi:hypothetical protein